MSGGEGAGRASIENRADVGVRRHVARAKTEQGAPGVLGGVKSGLKAFATDSRHCTAAWNFATPLCSGVI